MGRDSIGEVQISESQERCERGDTKVYGEDYGVFHGAGVSADRRIQTDRALEERRVQKAPLSPEVYLIGSQTIGQNR